MDGWSAAFGRFDGILPRQADLVHEKGDSRGPGSVGTLQTVYQNGSSTSRVLIDTLKGRKKGLEKQFLLLIGVLSFGSGVLECQKGELGK